MRCGRVVSGRVVLGVAVGLTLAGLILTAGCSSSRPKPRATGPTRTTIPVISIPRFPLPAANAIPDNPAEHKLVDITSCAPTPGGWMAAGTVRNPGTTAATYNITIFFDAGKQAIAAGQTIAIAEPGGSRDWTVTRQFVAPKGTKCVLRGVSSS